MTSPFQAFGHAVLDISDSRVSLPPLKVGREWYKFGNPAFRIRTFVASSGRVTKKDDQEGS